MGTDLGALEEQWHAAHELYNYEQSDRIARQLAAKLRAEAKRAATAEESARLRMKALRWEYAIELRGQ